MACPVCFGAVEETVRESTNNGILVLLVVTVGVLAGFARFALGLVRRSRSTSQMVEGLQL